MSLADRALAALERVLPAEEVSAHCDIPCAIYDPHAAQIGSLTVIRMVQLEQNLPKPDPNAPKEQIDAYINSMARYVAVKEMHAEICKKEILVLWTDYFKPEHLEQFPDLHDLVWKTAKLCSKGKHGFDMQSSQELHESVLKIAEIFWQSKGARPQRQPSLQQAGGELVYPQAQ